MKKKRNNQLDATMEPILKVVWIVALIIAIILLVLAFMGIEPFNRSDLNTPLITRHGRKTYVYLYPFELFGGISFFCYAVFCEEWIKNTWIRRIYLFAFLPIGLMLRLYLDKTWGNIHQDGLIMYGVLIVVCYFTTIYFIVDKMLEKKAEEEDEDEE